MVECYFSITVYTSYFSTELKPFSFCVHIFSCTPRKNYLSQKRRFLSTASINKIFLFLPNVYKGINNRALRNRWQVEVYEFPPNNGNHL